jgi:hypothetical protein
MCRVGEFNLSQASLTSLAALTALRQLANTNTTLYHEITGGNTVTEAAKNEEPDFPEDSDIQTNDGSDIPVDVIITHIMSGGSAAEGFKVNDEGSIMQIGVAEETDLHIELMGDKDKPLGRSHRVKFGSKRYKTAEWEEA